MLTVKQIEAAKPKEKPYRLLDGNGLYLYVPVSGKKVWQLRYKIDGKEKILTVGKYPLMTLQEARDKAWTARKDISVGLVDRALIYTEIFSCLGLPKAHCIIFQGYPVTPDGWISCSERMPAQDDWILIYSKHGEYMAGQVQGEYVELSDGTLSWLGNALYWMPLPEPPQEVNRG